MDDDGDDGWILLDGDSGCRFKRVGQVTCVVCIGGWAVGLLTSLEVLS